MEKIYVKAKMANKSTCLFSLENIDELETFKRSGCVPFSSLWRKLCPDSVLNNTVIDVIPDFYLESGEEYDEDGNPLEIFQWYIVGDNDAIRLEELTNEMVFYSESLDMNLVGITHFGTSWRGVPTEFEGEMVDY